MVGVGELETLHGWHLRFALVDSIGLAKARHWVELKITVLHHEPNRAIQHFASWGQSFEDQLLSVLLEARSYMPRRYGLGESNGPKCICEVNIGESETTRNPVRSWMFLKIVVYPQIIHFNRDFHYKPSILGYPYFWKHPFGYRIAPLPPPIRRGVYPLPTTPSRSDGEHTRWYLPVEVAFSDMENTLPCFNSKDQHQKKTTYPREGYQRNTCWTHHRPLSSNPFSFNTPKAISFTSVGLLLCSSAAARLLEASLGQRMFLEVTVATVLLYSQ